MLTVSVVTLFHNRRDLSAAYLRQWSGQGVQDQPLELLFGDNQSTDGTAELVARFDRAKVTCFPTNLGFSGGNNALAKQAKGDVLVFLNNDVELTPGWLKHIQGLFEGRPTLGILGNIQLSVRTSAPDHAGVFFDPEGSPYHYRPGLDELEGLPPLFPTPAVTGACLAIRRELFAALGGFDLRYRNSYEDTDLCLRARAHGAEVAVATRSIIWHYICSSPGRQSAENINARHFAEQWGKAAQALSRYLPPQLPKRPSPKMCDWVRVQPILQVYYPGPERYREENSSLYLYPSDRWTRLEIPLPSRSEREHQLPLRLDPKCSGAKFHLGGVALYSGRSPRRLKWQTFGPDLLSYCTVGGTAHRVKTTRGFILESTGDDPQISIALPREILSSNDDLTLQVWLKTCTVTVNPAPSVPAPKKWTGLRRLRSRHILVDLWRLEAGGANGGVKVFVLALLRDIARRQRWKLRFTVITNAAVAAELGTTLRPARVFVPSASDYDSGKPVDLEKGDVVYAPLGFSRLDRPELPQVSLIVDLLHRDLPQMLPPDEVAFRERSLVETFARSTILQCNSHFVADRLAYHYGIESARTVIVYNAVQDRLRLPRSQPSVPKVDSAENYFLYPANDWPHKNHFRLLQAYARYRASCPQPWNLHFTGFTANHSALEKAISELALTGQVKIHGHLDLPLYIKLFKASGALIFPSLYEGLGIPLLEAMALGIPVGCSRAASLPEVGADACCYFDPLNEVEIANCLVQLSTDQTLREKLIRLGKKRARAFSVKTEFDRLARVFRTVSRITS